MNTMTLQGILALVLAHKWVPLAAVAIGLAVRLVKEDTTVPVNVPARWRPMFALTLGIVGGVAEAVATGTPVGAALVQGLQAALVAIAGHDTLVEGLRKGRDFAIPFVTRKLKGAAVASRSMLPTVCTPPEVQAKIDEPKK